MGDLAEHVARTAMLRHPTCAVPEALTSVFTEMGQVCDQMAAKIAHTLSTLDARRRANAARVIRSGR